MVAAKSIRSVYYDAAASISTPRLFQVPHGGRLRLRDSLRPLVLVSHLTGITFFTGLAGLRLRLAAAYRLLIFSALVACLVHELPTIKYWVSNVRGLHAMLACVETWYRWAILFINFLLNVSNNARIAETVSLLVDLPVIVEATVYSGIYRFEVFIVLFNLLLIVCYMSIGHDEMWNNVNYAWYTSTIYIVTEFYIAFSNIQFIGVLYAIREYFKTVNEHLRRCTLSVSALRDRRTFLFVVDGSYKQEGGLLDIVKFRELHLNLSCICLKLNQCYTVQILLFLVLCMIEITYSLRSCMVFIVTSDESVEGNDWAQKPWLEVILTIFWGGYYFVSLLELVTSCDFTATESRQTSIIVHELINKVQDKNLERQVMAGLEKVTQKLQLFSLQLMNHAASFTAGRFFQLDFALLHSIIGAITTYLVIIITFRE